MVAPALFAALNVARKAILDAAELTLPANKFPTYRKAVLKVMGRDGLERELQKIIDEMKRDRNG